MTDPQHHAELDVARLAHLARLALPPDRAAAIARDLDRVLDAFETLRASTAPSASILSGTSGDAPGRDSPVELSTLRADEVTTHPAREAILDNAPVRVDQAFSVPRVIE